MEDIAEQQEVANEIADAISNPVGFARDVDEDDLLKELEQLEQVSNDQMFSLSRYTADRRVPPAIDSSAILLTDS